MPYPAVDACAVMAGYFRLEAMAELKSEWTGSLLLSKGAGGKARKPSTIQNRSTILYRVVRFTLLLMRLMARQYMLVESLEMQIVVQKL